MIRNIHPSLMSQKDLNKFLEKINQLNQIVDLIKSNPKKRLELSKCNNHEDVINLTSKWGFKIGKRWGE